LSIFDIEDVELYGNEDEVDDQRSIRRDDGTTLQSGTGAVDGRVGEQSAGLATPDGGDPVRVDATSGVRPAVSPDRDEDIGGRGDGTARFQQATSQFRMYLEAMIVAQQAQLHQDRLPVVEDQQ